MASPPAAQTGSKIQVNAPPAPDHAPTSVAVRTTDATPTGAATPSTAQAPSTNHAAAPPASETPLDALARKRALAEAGGGPERVARQHEAGKLTARERLDRFLDPGSFLEIDPFIVSQGTSRGLPFEAAPGDGLVAGFGNVLGRPVAVLAQDFTVLGGSMGAAQGRKVCKVLDHALTTGVPVVSFNDSGGARIQEGIASLGAYGDIFMRNVNASGVVPQISVIAGPCAGGAVYSPALTDFVVAIRGTGHLFVTGPDVVKTVTHEVTTANDLGGADVHAERSGVATIAVDNEEAALDFVTRLLSYLPSNNLEVPPQRAAPAGVPLRDDWLNTAVPDDPQKSYDVRTIIERLVDPASFLELQPAYAQNLVIGFARVEGRVIGLVANQPRVLAGVLDVTASEKGARFIRFCDAFNIPLVTLVDVPGYLPGTSQEHDGIIRRGAKLLYAYCEATVPKITVILRKAYGGAYIVMGSKHLGADVNLAWPFAEVAVLGESGAVNILYRRELAKASDPDAARAKLETEYRERFRNPWFAAEIGYVDDVIEPALTRAHLTRHLARLSTKRQNRAPRKHGNIPL